MTGTALNTVLLTPGTWDLMVDGSGNIAVVGPPYSLAQDAASAIKTVLGEVWYDTTIGFPWSKVLGKLPSMEFLRSQLIATAETVPGVVSAQVFFTSFVNRVISGQVQITDASGNVVAVGF